jgi:hypothetical protein
MYENLWKDSKYIPEGSVRPIRKIILKINQNNYFDGIESLMRSY